MTIYNDYRIEWWLKLSFQIKIEYTLRSAVVTSILFSVRKLTNPKVVESFDSYFSTFSPLSV